MADITAWIVGEVKQGITLPSLHKQIGMVTEKDTVTVNIISEGGSYHEGMDCYNYLKSLPCNVVTVAKGTVASIATLIQLAAPKQNRFAESYSKPLIHNPWGEISGDAKTMQNYSDALKATEDELVGIYVSETGSDEQAIRSAMEANDFITVEEYQELGFISKVLEPIKAVAILDIQEKPINKSDQSIMNQIEKKLNSMFASISNKLGIKNEFTETKAMVMELEDGSKINIVTESESPEVGNPVQLEDGTPASDGDYTLADGSVIRVEAGVISEVVAAMSEDEDEEMKALKAENETLKASVSELNAKLETYAKTVEVINAKLEQSYVAPTRNSFKAKKVSDEPKPLFTKDDLKTTPKTK
jgi:ATP-dependent Clp protease protease subunit